MKHGSRNTVESLQGNIQQLLGGQERLEDVVQVLSYKDSWFCETWEVVKETHRQAQDRKRIAYISAVVASAGLALAWKAKSEKVPRPGWIPPKNIETVTVEEARAHGLTSREILGRCQHDRQSQALTCFHKPWTFIRVFCKWAISHLVLWILNDFEFSTTILHWSWRRCFWILDCYWRLYFERNEKLVYIFQAWSWFFCPRSICSTAESQASSFKAIKWILLTWSQWMANCLTNGLYQKTLHPCHLSLCCNMTRHATHPTRLICL